jgi:hypothetical protein
LARYSLKLEDAEVKNKLEDAEVSRTTRKFANGRSGGDAKLHGECYKALEKGTETRVFH